MVNAIERIDEQTHSLNRKLNDICIKLAVLETKAVVIGGVWGAVVGGKFDTMLADANAATNLAQAKAVLIEIINVLRKSDRVTYWLAKNSKT